MDIVSWNVNSLRARLPRVLDFLERTRPEVVCLQETKVKDEDLPREPLEDLGYEVAVFGQRTYNGVAILSRVGIEDVRYGFGDEEWDAERRVLGATVGGEVMLLNLYVVNGKSVGTDAYRHKLAWMERLRRHVEESYDVAEKLVLCGDFNCTVDDRDVWDPKRWAGRILCSEPERAALRGLVDLGLEDAYRRFHEESGRFTWWDYRGVSFKRNEGLRIDHFLMSPPALEACRGVEIETAERGGSKPSDHAPVVARLG